MTDQRYPIGPFVYDPNVTPQLRSDSIAAIAALPAGLAAAASGLTDEQLDTPYREGGWSVRQLIHHVADSHLNAMVRLKLTMTETNPTIKPYDEAAWARLADTALDPVISLRLLEALHARWDVLWKSLGDDDWARTFHHPEMKHDLTLDVLVQLYAWHSRHHTAHVTALRERMGW